MSLAEIVGCAPFRLASPRALTAFEWAVVHTTMGRAMDEVVFGLGRSPEVAQLVFIMQSQPCADWRTSRFGPAPAVATFWYKCFARWYASHPDMARAQIRAQLAGGSLCKGIDSGPWTQCPVSKGQTATDLWEGGPQIVEPPMLPLATDTCSKIRQRTIYMPAKGKELLRLVEFLGPQAQVPADLVRMASLMPAIFLEREFLIGFQAKLMPDPAVMAGQLPQDMPGLAMAVFEDVALIWAPGKGASVMDLLKGPLDIGRLMALLGMMSPDLFGVLGGLISPELINAYGPALTGILGAAGQILPGLFGQPLMGLGALAATASPGTKPVTGLRLIDQTREQIARSPGPDVPIESGGGGTNYVWMGVAAVAAFVILAIAARE